jgi:hypothetical protein
LELGACEACSLKLREAKVRLLELGTDEVRPLETGGDEDCFLELSTVE